MNFSMFLAMSSLLEDDLMDVDDTEIGGRDPISDSLGLEILGKKWGHLRNTWNIQFFLVK